MDNKSELRELFRRIRASASHHKGDSAALNLEDNFKTFLIKHPIAKDKVISAYLPAFSEISPLPIMEYLINSGYKVVVPVVAEKNAPLEFHPWNNDVCLHWGICKTLEPVEITQSFDPDVLLMPMLAFDALGHRLGMGGGYYDRTIEALHKKNIFPVLIGLAFLEQFIDELPKEEYDQPLNYVITEQRIFEF